MRIIIPFILFLFFVSHHIHAQNFEVKLLMDINKSRGASFTNAMKGISVSMYPLSVATPVAIYFSEKGVSKPHTFDALTALVVTGLATHTTKVILKRPRPFQTYADIVMRDNAGGYSFPSGHTSFAFCTATSLALHYHKWQVTVPAFIWAGAVAYSRMHLGVHYPTDVLGGMLVGISAPLLVHYIGNKIRK